MSIRKRRGNGDWLTRAHAVMGGLLVAADNLADFMDWRPDPTTPDDVLLADGREHFRAFEDSFVAVANAYNLWLGLDHPSIGVIRRESRQWGALNIAFKTMLKCLDGGCSAYLLQWLGDEGDRASAEPALSHATTLFHFCGDEGRKTMDGSLLGGDGTLQWADDVILQAQKLDDFMSSHGQRALSLRTEAGL